MRIWIPLLLLATSALGQTQPATTQAALPPEVEQYLFVDPAKASLAGYKNTDWLSESFVDALADPRMLTAGDPPTRKSDMPLSRLFNGANAWLNTPRRQQVAKAALPLLDSKDCDARETDELAKIILLPGGMPAVTLLEQIVAGRQINAVTVLAACEAAASEGRFGPADGARAFDALVRSRQRVQDRDYLDVLCFLDRKRAADYIATAGMLDRGHAEHRPALKAAVTQRLVLPADLITKSLDAQSPTAKQPADVNLCHQLMQLLAIAHPAAAEKQCAELLQSTPANAALDEKAKRRWTLLAVRGQLTARKLNHNCLLRFDEEKKAAPPAPVVTMRRVSAVIVLARSREIGWYFNDRTPDAMAADLAAFEALGATAMRDQLKALIDAPGPQGQADTAESRVRAVRAMDQPTLRQFGDVLKTPADDIELLMLQYQLKHADSIALWLSGLNFKHLAHAVYTTDAYRMLNLQRE